MISYGLLENSPCGFMSPRRIYDVSHRHHSWPPFMRDRTSAVPWRVCCSFRERKLEFLSTQTVETPRFCSFAGKLPLFCLRKTTKNEGIFGPCPRAHFHGSTTRGHCKAPAPTTVGPADQGARLPLASKRRYLRGRVKGHRGGGRKVPRGSPDAPNCGQVAPTTVRRRCAQGPRWARPGARRRRAPGIVVNYRETERHDGLEAIRLGRTSCNRRAALRTSATCVRSCECVF